MVISWPIPTWIGNSGEPRVLLGPWFSSARQTRWVWPTPVVSGTVRVLGNLVICNIGSPTSGSVRWSNAGGCKVDTTMDSGAGLQEVNTKKRCLSNKFKNKHLSIL